MISPDSLLREDGSAGEPEKRQAVKVGEFRYAQDALSSLSAKPGYVYIITLAKQIPYKKDASHVFYIGKADGYDWRCITSLGERLIKASKGEYGVLDNPDQIAALYVLGVIRDSHLLRSEVKARYDARTGCGKPQTPNHKHQGRS